MMVDRVEQDQEFPGQVIHVSDLNGFRVSYLMINGTLWPVRIWSCLGPGGERVSLALPMPDGPPTVLGVAVPNPQATVPDAPAGA